MDIKVINQRGCKMENKRFQKYTDYIKNTGGEPKVSWFIDDWEPIGAIVLNDMLKEGLIDITVGTISKGDEEQRIVSKQPKGV